MGKCRTIREREPCVSSGLGAHVKEQLSRPTEARSADKQVNDKPDLQLEALFSMTATVV